jgi:hypothetical protein
MAVEELVVSRLKAHATRTLGGGRAAASDPPAEREASADEEERRSGEEGCEGGRDGMEEAVVAAAAVAREVGAVMAIAAAGDSGKKDWSPEVQRTGSRRQIWSLRLTVFIYVYLVLVAQPCGVYELYY